MGRAFVLVLIILCGLLLAGCGIFQVGVEAGPAGNSAPTSTPPAAATRMPESTSLPAPSAPPSPTANVTLPPPVRIYFGAGSTLYTLTASLRPGAPQTYVLQISAGQKLFVTATHSATITVLDARNQPLPATSNGPGEWQGQVPETADYIIVLRGEMDSVVTIRIPPPGS